MKTVCVVTGTRADYGLLQWVIRHVEDSKELNLQLVATGMHLSPEFGLTWREIEADGFHIDRRVETLMSSDTSVGIAKSMGLGMIGFADAFAELRPDMVLVLGDRFEIFAAAAAAMAARIPIAHLHGGEATEGLIDEAIRHSITKMSQLHFVATEKYRQRVVQLGEHPDSVFLVGGLGIDSILGLPLLEKDELEESLCFRFNARNLLITFHPVTLEQETSIVQVEEMIAALDELKDTNLIFTMPNADTDGRAIFESVSAYASSHENAKVFTSLGQLRYLSCIRQVDGVVGNSSSGLAEVPSFKKGTVNIGDRQKGRVRASSVINCNPDRESIAAAIDRLYSLEFQESLRATVNPYGQGGASKAVVEVIESISTRDLLKKKFFDTSAQ
jgi:GDP/UDP-N,N'-diacetylbacillosamine 2-epimerase (hydrolysing)